MKKLYVLFSFLILLIGFCVLVNPKGTEAAYGYYYGGYNQPSYSGNYYNGGSYYSPSYKYTSQRYQNSYAPYNLGVYQPNIYYYADTGNSYSNGWYDPSYDWNYGNGYGGYDWNYDYGYNDYGYGSSSCSFFFCF